MASQVSASKTAQPFAAPKVETYTVCVAWSSSALDGLAPTLTVGGGADGQPAGWMALQVALSIIETLVSPWSGTYTVWLTGSATGATGPSPTGTEAGACLHPDVTVALHVAPLTTDTVLTPELVTYTVSVCSSTAIPLGWSSGVSLPTVMAGHGPGQRERSSALQRRASMTATVSPSPLGPL